MAGLQRGKAKPTTAPKPKRARKPATEEPAALERTDGRDEAGRWLPGCPAGPGRRPGYAAVFREVLTPEELGAVLRAVLAKAKDGDLRAAELILRRAVPELPNEDSLLTSPEWIQLRAVIVHALQVYPEASRAVSEALSRVEAMDAGPVEVEVPENATPEEVAQAIAAAIARSDPLAIG